MISSIKKRTIAVNGKKIFVQVLGAGPPIALLHPSPHSSEMLLPLAQKLADSFTVLCVDTPGYGHSDGLDEPPKDVRVYAEMLKQLFDKMQISTLAIYGSATGAQIAIRLGLEYPKLVSHLFLDNAAHFSESLRTNILAQYFPDLTSVKNGNHLKRLWDMVSHMFLYFPWCFKTEEYALQRPQIPLEALHSIALDFLKAGPAYYYAYKVAFEHEQAIFVQQLTVNTCIFRWEGSIVLPYITQLTEHPFPEHIQVVPIAKDPSIRMDVMVAHMKECYLESPSYELPDDLGEEWVVQPEGKHTIKLPEVTSDGSYLLEAWNRVSELDKSAAPSRVQEVLVNLYTQQGDT